MKEAYIRNRIIAGVVVVVILIGFLVFALVHSSSPATTPKKGHPTTASTPQAQNKPSQPQTNGGSGGSQGGRPAQSNPAALSDSGPGDVAALFAVASVVGYGGYVYVLSKRAAANKTDS